MTRTLVSNLRANLSTSSSRQGVFQSKEGLQSVKEKFQVRMMNWQLQNRCFARETTLSYYVLISQKKTKKPKTKTKKKHMLKFCSHHKTPTCIKITNIVGNHTI